MALKIKQEADYQGDDWWDWSVWLDGPKDELDQIKYVEYILDPTFPQPTRRIRERSSGFRLDTGGWGEFTIHARVVFKDGKEKSLKHYLRLYYPAGERT